MCVCVCVCVCYDVIRLGGKVNQSSLHEPLHPQLKWQATLRTIGGSQTLFVLWSSKPDIRIASEGDLVLQGDSSGRSDLDMDKKTLPIFPSLLCKERHSKTLTLSSFAF